MGFGLFYSKRFLDHDTGYGHPENPERLKAVVDYLQESPLWNSIELIEPEIKDINLPTLVHDGAYVKRVHLTCNRGDQYIDTFDNAICHDSYQIAILAVNAVTQGIDHVFKAGGNRAMVLPRPPGHHAEYNQAMGFCLFNNVAIAARYAQKAYDLQRIAIIDFDVHHGNGTQHLFEKDPDVLYLSTHRYPFFPGTGAENETGWGDGIGATINYPLPAGTEDEKYIDIFQNSAADKILQFKPELIILSAGFDAHYRDPIGGMRLTTDGYHEISGILSDISDECCQGRLLSVLEGGYDPEGISTSVEAHLQSIIKG